MYDECISVRIASDSWIDSFHHAAHRAVPKIENQAPFGEAHAENVTGVLGVTGAPTDVLCAFVVVYH
jgi:hypothetical protein